MKKIRKCISDIYPLVLLSILFIIGLNDRCQAGHIRTLVLKPDVPSTVYVALGKSTAISFPSKPEKLVPGSPEKSVIEFATASDIIISPKAHGLGNLIVYTKAGRYVIIFGEGSQANYDDAINVRFSELRQPLRLLDDSYHLEELRISFKPKTKAVKEKTVDVSALVTSNGLKISGDELFSALRDLKGLSCHGCTILHRHDESQFICGKVLLTFECESSQYSKIKFVRRTP